MIFLNSLPEIRYADRARKIRNKPVINAIDQQASKIATMQERIEFLEEQLKIQDISSEMEVSQLEDISNGSKSNMQVSDLDNDQLINYFVEELKSRTIRGTSKKI
jgi:hypothetical protein